METMKRSEPGKRPLSLSPLSFDGAVTDILKIQLEPKPPKKNAERQRSGRLAPSKQDR